MSLQLQQLQNLKKVEQTNEYSGVLNSDTQASQEQMMYSNNKQSQESPTKQLQFSPIQSENEFQQSKNDIYNEQLIDQEDTQQITQAKKPTKVVKQNSPEKKSPKKIRFCQTNTELQALIRNQRELQQLEVAKRRNLNQSPFQSRSILKSMVQNQSASPKQKTNLSFSPDKQQQQARSSIEMDGPLKRTFQEFKSKQQANARVLQNITKQSQVFPLEIDIKSDQNHTNEIVDKLESNNLKSNIKNQKCQTEYYDSSSFHKSQIQQSAMRTLSPPVKNRLKFQTENRFFKSYNKAKQASEFSNPNSRPVSPQRGSFTELKTMFLRASPKEKTMLKIYNNISFYNNNNSKNTYEFYSGDQCKSPILHSSHMNFYNQQFISKCPSKMGYNNFISLGNSPLKKQGSLFTPLKITKNMTMTDFDFGDESLVQYTTLQTENDQVHSQTSQNPFKMIKTPQKQNVLRKEEKIKKLPSFKARLKVMKQNYAVPLYNN